MDIRVVRRDGDDSGPLEVEFGVDYEFDYQTAEQRVATVIDSGTVTIRNGSTIYVDADPVVPDLVGGFSYVWLKAVHPDEPIEDVIIEFFLLSGTDEFDAREVLDVVRYPLRVPIKEEDLFVTFPILRDTRRLGLEEGLADSSSTDSTLQADQLIGYEDGFYVGGEVDIIAGTNDSESRRVTGFDGSTGVVTVSPAFSAALDDTSSFRLRRSWQPLIALAWGQMRERIKNRGNRAALIMDGQAFRTALIYVAGSLAYYSMALGAPDDPMQMLGDEYDKRGWDWFDATKFHYDATDSGDPSGVMKLQVTHISRR